MQLRIHNELLYKGDTCSCILQCLLRCTEGGLIGLNGTARFNTSYFEAQEWKCRILLKKQLRVFYNRQSTAPFDWTAFTAYFAFNKHADLF